MVEYANKSDQSCLVICYANLYMTKFIYKNLFAYVYCINFKVAKTGSTIVMHAINY